MAENVVIIPSPLRIPEFDPKVQKMMSKPNTPRNLVYIRQKGEELIRDVCSNLRINMIRSGTLAKHKWELLDGNIFETDNDFPPWKNMVIRGQEGKLYKLLPSHPDDLNSSAKEMIAATNWTNLALSSLERFSRAKFDNLEKANSEMKLLLDRILQKQDYNTMYLNEHVNTLAENDQTIAQSLDKLSLKTEKQIHDVAIAHGREIVRVNNNLDLIKGQVKTVSSDLATLKKKPNTESYKSATLFSNPVTTVPYSISPSVESLIKTQSIINFPPPTSSHPYSLFANPSFFTPLPKSVPKVTLGLKKEDEESKEFKGSFSEFFASSSHDKEEEKSDAAITSVNKIDDTPKLKKLESCINNFSQQDKEKFGISELNPSEEIETSEIDQQVHATTSRSTWTSTWNPAPDRRDLMKSEYHKDWSASSTYSWNIDNCTEAELMSVLHSMLVCYRTYLADDIGPINATRRIIAGFEGTLDSWLKAETLKLPTLLSQWEQSVILNADGTTYMDPVTTLPVNNMIGCLIYGIAFNFLRSPMI